MGLKKIEVMGKVIQAGDELVSLTDLWRAGGGGGEKKPRRWLVLQGTKDFTAKLSETLRVKDSSLLKVNRGRGTFAHWQIALAYAKWLSPELHLQVNDVYRRFQEADPAIAESVIDRTEDPAALFRIESRARNKASNRELNSTISQHGGEGRIYAQVANVNNIAITGKTAKQIRAENNLPAKASTRPLLSTEDMIRMAYAELLESKSIAKRRCIGNDEILGAVNQVARGVRDLESAYI